MLTFEQAYEHTSKVSSHTAYSEAECRLLFEVAMRTPRGGVMVEIGCEYGRSTSMLLQIAKELGAELHLVEPHPKPELIEMLCNLSYPFILYVSKSGVTYGLPDTFHFLHIDGDHDYEGVMSDLQMFVPFTEGYVICHDFERESLPDVTRAIRSYLFSYPKLYTIGRSETALALTTL